MLNALIVVAALGLSQSDNLTAVETALSLNDSAPAGTIVLARGGRERLDPFAEIKERRKQAAQQKREQERQPTTNSSQGQPK